MNDPRQAIALAFVEYVRTLIDDLRAKIEAHNATAPPETIIDPSTLTIMRHELRQLLPDIRSGRFTAAEIRQRLLRLRAEHEERDANRKQPVESEAVQ